jgi:RNA polymerase sigma factor CnrH
MLNLNEASDIAPMTSLDFMVAWLPLSPCDALTDSELVEYALSGEQAAFTILMSRHQEWVLRFIRRHVRVSEDAYDLLQDTFLAVWRSLARYRQDRPFDAWVRRIALNKCRDRARRAAVRHMLGGRFNGDDAVEIADPAPGPAAQIESQQELQQLEKNMQKLSPSLKQPLLLSVIEGLSHFEVGRLLGMSPKAVETRVYRARARLEQLGAANALSIA